jgi:pimeloyl-ACP methyl ester carboxylesterase
LSTSESMSTATEAARARAIYDLGATSVFACRSDPRFSYCLYVPPGLATTAEPPELIVAVHGTGRTFTAYRDAFAEFGRWHNCVILAPLFPIGVLGDGNRDGFKYIREGDIRYDRVLLDMVAQVSEAYGVAFERFALFGYSGGGHFANRFLILHPDRLFAVSIGAPGSVTLLDAEHDWWVGVRDLEALFDVKPDIAAMRRVAVQMVVGAADLETWEITHREGGRHFMPGANDAGRTRPERLASLQASFEAKGIAVRLDLIPNMAHDGQRAVDSVKGFLREVLDRRRGEAAASGKATAGTTATERNPR